MRLLRQSRRVPVPRWVTDPSPLADDAKPIVIDVVELINRRTPGYDMWWTGTMSTRDRATRIVDELGRVAVAPWAAACCADPDQYKVNMSLVVQPHIVRQCARALRADDEEDSYLSQYDSRHNVPRISDCTECRQARYRDATIGTITAIIARCEREGHRRSAASRSSLSSSSSLVRGLCNLVTCGRRKKTDFQNWMLRPELLAADLESLAIQIIRDLNGSWFGMSEVHEWETPLTTARRVDMIHARLMRQLNDQVTAAARQRRTAEMLVLIFAPHQVREIEPRLLKTLQRKCERHHYPEHKLTEAFWDEVRRSLLKLMHECEELSDRPSRCWLAHIRRWWKV